MNGISRGDSRSPMMNNQSSLWCISLAGNELGVSVGSIERNSQYTDEYERAVPSRFMKVAMLFRRVITGVNWMPAFTQERFAMRTPSASMLSVAVVPHGDHT